MTGTNEKKINLEIARKVRKELEERGYQVVMTREDDNGLYTDSDSNKKTADMKKRCRMAEESNADILVSIHQNSYQDPSVCGPQVFFYEHSADGEALAKCIQDSLNTELAIARPRVHKGNGSYYILKRSEGTTVIVECGFLSNPQEEEKLQQTTYQDQVVQAVFDGTMAYLSEKNAGS